MQGFRIRIRIDLSCCIRIQVHKVHLNFGRNFFYICKKLSFLHFFHEKKLIFLTGPQNKQEYPKGKIIINVKSYSQKRPGSGSGSGSGSALIQCRSDILRRISPSVK